MRLEASTATKHSSRTSRPELRCDAPRSDQKSEVPWWTFPTSLFSFIYKSPIMAQDVALETSMGTIVCELYVDHAPKVHNPLLESAIVLITKQTCTNFTTLAKRGYYNDTIFHRIIPSFMIQGGDPTGTGRGGESMYGPKFEDEIDPSLKHTGAGILSMANSGPNTNGSQFFITLAPTPWLDGKHTIFGRVKSGLRVVQRMGLVGTDSEDRPREEIKIVGARILEAGEE